MYLYAPEEAVQMVFYTLFLSCLEMLYIKPPSPNFIINSESILDTGNLRKVFLFHSILTHSATLLF